MFHIFRHWYPFFLCRRWAREAEGWQQWSARAGSWSTSPRCFEPRSSGSSKEICHPSNFQERRVTRVVRKGGGNESDESDDERGEVEEVEEVEGVEGEGSGPSETGTYTVEEKEESGNQVIFWKSFGGRFRWMALFVFELRHCNALAFPYTSRTLPHWYWTFCGRWLFWHFQRLFHLDPTFTLLRMGSRSQITNGALWEFRHRHVCWNQTSAVNLNILVIANYQSVN